MYYFLPHPQKSCATLDNLIVTKVSDRMESMQNVMITAEVVSPTIVCASSVARGEGGCSPPIGVKNMQNTTFLALLKTIFALKTKIAPPPLALAIRIGQEPEVISTRKTGFQPG